MQSLKKNFAEIGIFKSLSSNAFRLFNVSAFLPFGDEPPLEDFLLDGNNNAILDANDNEILVPEF